MARLIEGLLRALRHDCAMELGLRRRAGRITSALAVVLAFSGIAAAAPTGAAAAHPAATVVDAGTRSALQQALGKALVEQGKLQAPDFAANDEFGSAVAVHGDTAVIGAPLDDIGANVDQGSAYVFVRQGSTWALQVKMTAFDGAAGDGFGSSVAVYGDRVVVGAPRDDVGSNVNQGSVYVLGRDAGGWYFATKITEGSGSASDYFGTSVALTADALAVGVPYDDYFLQFEIDIGSVQVFVPGAGPFDPWTRQRRLVADATFNADQGALLGASVAFSGDSLIAGAPYDGYGGTGEQRGAAFVFVRSGTTWTTQAKLLGTASSPDANFGQAVALYGDTAVVGAPADAVGADILLGSAYVFTRSGTTWAPGVRLLPSDPELELRFGDAVAVSEDTVVVGARVDDIGANPYQGSAYVFQRSVGGTWLQRQKLLAPDGAAGDRYGVALAMYGRTVVVGAYNDSTGATLAHGSAHVVVADDVTVLFGHSVAVSGLTMVAGVPRDSLGSGFFNGSAYVYERLSTGWSLQARVVPRDSGAGDQFGFSGALDGETLLVGAPEKWIGSTNNAGVAYVFERKGSHWLQVARLVASDFGANGRFGAAVALAGDLAVVGSPGRSAVYVFRRTAGAWPQVARLSAADGATGVDFGISVATDGVFVVVGAPKLNVAGNLTQGAVYVFEESPGVWIQRAQLFASDGASGDYFGSAVALAADTVLVGAPYDDVGVDVDEGSAYAFVRAGGIWAQQQHLVLPMGSAYQRAGAAVALASGRALVGAPRGGSQAGGAAQMFLRSGADWIPQGMLAPPVPQVLEEFGAAVALSPLFAVCGAPFRDLQQGGSLADGAGIAYVFSPPPAWAFESQVFAAGVVSNRIFADGFE